MAMSVTGLTLTAAGGIPSTVSRWTTLELGLSTETTYSVAVDDSDCTGASVANFGSGPYVLKDGAVAPASSCCLFTIHSSAPMTGANELLQLAKTSAPSTTMPSATPSRGWSAQPGAWNEYVLHAPVGSLVCETASRTLLESMSDTDASQRAVGVSYSSRGSVSWSPPLW